MVNHTFAVVNHAGEIETVLFDDDLLQFRYSIELNGIGGLTMTIKPGREHASLKVHDNMIHVYRDDGVSQVLQQVYFIDVTTYISDDNGNFPLIVGGVSPEDLTDRRAYLPEDDPLVADGFSTKSGPADSVMREIMDEQMVNPATNAFRAVSGLSLAPVGGFANNAAVREELGDKLVIDLLTTIAKASGMDWRIASTGNATFEFQAAVQGTDRRKSVNYPGQPFTYLTPQAGTLRSASLTIASRKSRNYFYIYGDGKGPTRPHFVQPSAPAYASPWSLREKYIGSAGDTFDEMTTKAYEAIEEHKAKKEMSFVPDLAGPGMRYGHDWELGDKVTTQIEGDEIEARIKVVTFDVSPNEVISVEIEAL